MMMNNNKIPLALWVCLRYYLIAPMFVFCV